MNWNNTRERLALLEQVGPVEYTRRLEENARRAEHIVATVNGFRIVQVPTCRGRMYQVEGLAPVFDTIDQANGLALTLRPVLS